MVFVFLGGLILLLSKREKLRNKERETDKGGFEKFFKKERRNHQNKTWCCVFPYSPPYDIRCHLNGATQRCSSVHTFMRGKNKTLTLLHPLMTQAAQFYFKRQVKRHNNIRKFGLTINKLGKNITIYV